MDGSSEPEREDVIPEPEPVTFTEEETDVSTHGFFEESEEEVQVPKPLRKRTVQERMIAEWIIVEDEPAALHPVEEDPPPELPMIEEDPPPELPVVETAPTIAPGPPAKAMIIVAQIKKIPPINLHVRERIIQLRTVTRGAVREGARQYRVSITTGIPLIGQLVEDVKEFFRIIWRFLAQPVWVPTRKKQIKQYSRGTLFLLDIVRFGGTFVVIFLGLFVALNYDSFWQIAQSRVTSILESPSIESSQSEADNTMLQTLKASTAQSNEGKQRGELFSFLPNVGPPDNRMLIPKLHLNVPLITPPVASLLRQDWNQVEEDIQASLVEGIVHYPGTARPGQAGNFFVTGHSSYYPWAPGHYKTVFARLQDLVPGDEYWVYYKGDRHRYVVTEKKEVSPEDITVLDQPPDRRIATLMTCTPVGTTLRRLIVVAQEVDPLTRDILRVGERSEKGVTPKVQLEALPI